MRKPTTKTALVETVALPKVGDNSGIAGYALPMPEDTHRDIETTLAAIIKNESAIEYARQKLAHLLMDRHAQLVATRPSGSVPFAHDLATDNAAYGKYLDALVAEFTVADPAKLKDQTAEERSKYAGRMRARLERGLRLFVNLSWFKTNNPDLTCSWDADAMRWSIFPGAFVPPGFMAGGSLLMNKDGKTPRLAIHMESIDASANYFVSRGKGIPISVNLSLDQFNYVVQETIKSLRNPNVDTSDVQATSARAKRAARQRNAANDKDAPDVADEDSDTPEATAPSAQHDRAWYVTTLVRLMTGAEKLLNHDTLADLSWSDLPLDGVNAFTTVQMVIDRMNAKRDGVAKRKAA